ncbi:MAG TPA: ATP-binding protein [Pirellulales bacterium]|nr:ATP-binding protein [Pirellulales bacterium]
MNDRAPMTVLVVEDDEDTRANLCDILELDGYRVDAVGTMREALSRRAWSDVAMVILDRRLPDGSAEELLPRLKVLAPDADVIVATGYADLDGAITALRNGAADYIIKPIDPVALRAGLERAAERRRLIQAKARSEAAFRTLVEAAPTLTVILRTDGAILYVNPFAERLAGYSEAEVLGHDFATVFGDSTGRRKLMQRMLAARPQSPPARGFEDTLLDDNRVRGLLVSESPPARGFEDTLRCKNGLRRSIVWNAEMLADFDGQAAILAIGHDVTELNEAQRKALQAERLAAIGQMMTGLTHESRNALQRSKACLEMLALEVEDRPAALDLVRRIEKAQERLQHLYEEVRTYAAPINLKHDVCDLRALWRETWSHLAQIGHGKNVEFAEEIDCTDTHCRVDPFAIDQVFRNILENAVSAVPDEGQIRVACGASDLDGRPAVRIAFRDNGPGLTAEQRQRIFEPFYTTKTKGTGLGMAIAKRIVQSHGGLIETGEQPGPGAEIVVTLPRDME